MVLVVISNSFNGVVFLVAWLRQRQRPTDSSQYVNILNQGLILQNQIKVFSEKSMICLPFMSHSSSFCD